MLNGFSEIMFDAGNGHPYFFSCTFSLVPILPGAFPVPQWWDQYGQDTARFLPGGGNAVKQGAGISAIVLRVAKTAVKDGVTHKSGVSSSAVVGNYK